MVHMDPYLAISIPRWCFKYPLTSPRAPQEHPKNSAADPDRWSKTSQKPPEPKRINPDVLPRPRQARPMPTGNATGNAMGRRAWKKTSVGTQALEEHQGPGKVDLSWVQIWRFNFGAWDAKSGPLGVQKKRQGLVGLGRLVQFLLVILRCLKLRNP